MTFPDEGPGAPRARHKAETRAIILAAAIELFTAGSVTTTLTEDVAKKAEVSKATLFFHFGSRLGLLAAVGEELYYRGAHGDCPVEPGLVPYLRAYVAAQRKPEARVLWEIGDAAVAAGQAGPDTAYYHLVVSIQTRLGDDGVAAGHRAPLARTLAPAALLIARNTAFARAGDEEFARFLDDVDIVLRPWR